MKNYSLSNYDLIIFDCDGTLVDTEHISNSIVGEMIRELGHDLSNQAAYELFVGTSFAHITNYLKEHIQGELKFDLEKEFRRRSKIRFENELLAMPGVEEFLKSLDQSICVASNGPKEKMQVTLSVTNLYKYFNQGNMFSAYDIGVWKPNPDLFLYASKEMGISPNKCLVIEDTIPGVMAAINAEIDVIAYGDSFSSEEIKNLELQHFTSYDEIQNQLM